MLGAFRQIGIEATDIARRIGDDYDRQRLELVRPFPGAIETLETLRNSSVRLAMITNGNSASQRAKIDRFDLQRFFDYILVEEEFGAGKPDEQVYIHALEKLDATPSEAWIVGDNLEWEVDATSAVGHHGHLARPQRSWPAARDRACPTGPHHSVSIGAVAARDVATFRTSSTL